MTENKSIKAFNLDSIPSKFPLIRGEEMGKMRMCEFGVGADGIKRTCCKMEVKKGFQWTKCMPASVGGPVPQSVCTKTHFGYLAKGQMKIIMTETGEEKVLNEGDAYYIEPNHDAIMMTDVTAVEFESDAAEYYGKIEQ